MIVRFKRYSGYGEEISIVAAEISHWYSVNYNGRSGTCIVLKGGTEINVDAYCVDVEQAVVKVLRFSSAELVTMNESARGGLVRKSCYD